MHPGYFQEPFLVTRLFIAVSNDIHLHIKKPRSAICRLNEYRQSVDPKNGAEEAAKRLSLNILAQSNPNASLPMRIGETPRGGEPSNHSVNNRLQKSLASSHSNMPGVIRTALESSEPVQT
jgi:hypothetical protein